MSAAGRTRDDDLLRSTQAIIGWIADTAQTPLEPGSSASPFQAYDCLRNGVALCRLAARLFGPFAYCQQPRIPSQSLDNIARFLHVCQTARPAHRRTFLPIDLYQGSNLYSVHTFLSDLHRFANERQSPVRSQPQVDEAGQPADQPSAAEKSRQVERIRREVEEAERIRRQAEEAERMRKEAEKAERIRHEAEEAERARVQAEKAERIRRQAEEAERTRKEAEEAERMRKEAAEVERLQREAAEAAEAERVRKDAKTAERARREADIAERIRKEAEEVERLRREAEESERVRREAEETERIRREAEEVERLQRDAAQAEEAERVRRKAEESERVRREAEETERIRREAEEVERLQRDAAQAEEAERVRREAEEAERFRREAEEVERLQRDAAQAEEAERIRQEAADAERLRREAEEVERTRREAGSRKKGSRHRSRRSKGDKRTRRKRRSAEKEPTSEEHAVVKSLAELAEQLRELFGHFEASQFESFKQSAVQVTLRVRAMKLEDLGVLGDSAGVESVAAAYSKFRAKVVRYVRTAMHVLQTPGDDRSAVVAVQSDLLADVEAVRGAVAALCAGQSGAKERTVGNGFRCAQQPLGGVDALQRAVAAAPRRSLRCLMIHRHSLLLLGAGQDGLTAGKLVHSDVSTQVWQLIAAADQPLCFDIRSEQSGRYLSVSEPLVSPRALVKSPTLLLTAERQAAHQWEFVARSAAGGYSQSAAAIRDRHSNYFLTVDSAGPALVAASVADPLWVLTLAVRDNDSDEDSDSGGKAASSSDEQKPGVLTKQNSQALLPNRRLQFAAAKAGALAGSVARSVHMVDRQTPALNQGVRTAYEWMAAWSPERCNDFVALLLATKLLDDLDVTFLSSARRYLPLLVVVHWSFDAASDLELRRLCTPQFVGVLQRAAQASWIDAACRAQCALLLQTCADRGIVDAAPVQPLDSAEQLHRMPARSELPAGPLGVVVTVSAAADCEVAMKLLPCGLFRDGDAARLVDELADVAAVQHRNLVQLYQRPSIRGGRVCVPMALLDVSLADLLFDTRLPAALSTPARLLPLLLDVVNGLLFLHGRGYVHGDVKPENVLVRLSSDGERLECAQLSDYAVARWLCATAPLSAGHRAPEVRLGEAATWTAAADVWSLGVLLVESMTKHTIESYAQPFADFHVLSAAAYPAVLRVAVEEACLVVDARLRAPLRLVARLLQLALAELRCGVAVQLADNRRKLNRAPTIRISTTSLPGVASASAGVASAFIVAEPASALTWHPKDTNFKTEAEIVAAARALPAGLYEDPDFAATPASLLYADNACLDEVRDVVWKRPFELAPRPALFIDGAGENDVTQGALGDCWFCGALSVVATRPDLLKQLIVSYRPEHGFAQFRFYKMGAWRVVTVDDRIPSIRYWSQLRGEHFIPKYSRCRDANEMWVPLFEKAYAKLHGSYQHLIAGTPKDGLVDLTGGIGSSLDWTRDTSVTADALWARILHCLQEGWLMGASSNRPAAQCSAVGIMAAHAYALLDARELPGRNERLIRLRNPWGSEEWQGRWSDKSPLWTPELAAQLNHTLDADDGSFWICLDDFYAHFSVFDYCRIFHDDVGPVLDRYLFQDSWRAGANAGGGMSYPSWNSNPMFGLSINTPTTLYVSLHKTDPRTLPVRPACPLYHSLHLWRVADNRTKLCAPYADCSVVGTPLHAAREVVLDLCDVSPGHYLISAQLAKPGEESDFVLTVYADRAIEIFSISSSGAILPIASEVMPMLSSPPCLADLPSPADDASLRQLDRQLGRSTSFLLPSPSPSPSMPPPPAITQVERSTRRRVDRSPSAFVQAAAAASAAASPSRQAATLSQYLLQLEDQLG